MGAVRVAVMTRKDFVFGEKVHFAFRSPLAVLEVRKVKKDRGATRDFGKIAWRVTNVSIPGGAVQVGDVLTTRRVFHLARGIDREAAHAFDQENQPR